MNASTAQTGPAGFANPFDLSGRVVLVVGAGSGIGRATARLANALGATILLAGRSEAKLEATRRLLPAPDRAEMLPFDYLDAAAARAALAGISRIDHVAVPAVADENARRGAFLDLSPETMRASFDKFWGSVNVLRAAVPRMGAGGSVTLFASIAALKPPSPEGGLSVMNSVHAAVVALGRSLAAELAPIRVNVIAPGVVLTDVWTPERRDELRGWMERSLPARHAGEAEDLAQAAVSLMTNPYVTGAVQVVDGGLLLG